MVRSCQCAMHLETTKVNNGTEPRAAPCMEGLKELGSGFWILTIRRNICGLQWAPVDQPHSDRMLPNKVSGEILQFGFLGPYSRLSRRLAQRLSNKEACRKNFSLLPSHARVAMDRRQYIQEMETCSRNFRSITPANAETLPVADRSKNAPRA